jgi:hypothetical protein
MGSQGISGPTGCPGYMAYTGSIGYKGTQGPKGPDGPLATNTVVPAVIDSLVVNSNITGGTGIFDAFCTVTSPIIASLSCVFTANIQANTYPLFTQIPLNLSTNTFSLNLPTDSSFTITTDGGIRFPSGCNGCYFEITCEFIQVSPLYIFGISKNTLGTIASEQMMNAICVSSAHLDPVLINSYSGYNSRTKTIISVNDNDILYLSVSYQSNRILFVNSSQICNINIRKIY